MNNSRWIRETWDRGDTILIHHEEIKDDDGNLITDFTGYLFHASLKSAKTDADASAVAKLETGDFTTSGSAAKGYLETESLSLTLNTDYYLDAQIVDPNGYVATMIRRVIVFEQDTTRRVVDTV